MSDIFVEYIDHMGSDLSVVNAARVSFDKRSEFVYDEETDEHFLDEKDVRLINYLARHKHTSPFGHAFASFKVKAPVFVARQLVKHKFLRWNEISRRYVDTDIEFHEPAEWRGRSEDKKQGSSDETVHVPPFEEYWVDYEGGLAIDETTDFTKLTLEYYNHLIKSGVAPEQARMILPQSMMTEWYWSGSLDAFADMCNLRCKEDTQAETRRVADLINERMELFFPISWYALTYLTED